MKVSLNLGDLPAPKAGFVFNVDGLGVVKVMASGLEFTPKGKKNAIKTTWKKLADLLSEDKTTVKKPATKKAAVKKPSQKKTVAKKAAPKKITAKKLVKSSTNKKAKPAKKVAAKKK